MELRTFVANALLDILGGVKDAQQAADTGVVVPAVKGTYQSVEHGISNLQVVHFEVNVRAEESSGSEGRLGVVTALIGAGVSGKSSSESGQASRLSFSVPIQFPSAKSD